MKARRRIGRTGEAPGVTADHSSGHPTVARCEELGPRPGLGQPGSRIPEACAHLSSSSHMITVSAAATAFRIQKFPGGLITSLAIGPTGWAMAGDYWPTACPVESETLPLQVTGPSLESRPKTSALPKWLPVTVTPVGSPLPPERL